MFSTGELVVLLSDLHNAFVPHSFKHLFFSLKCYTLINTSLYFFFYLRDVCKEFVPHCFKYCYFL